MISCFIFLFGLCIEENLEGGALLILSDKSAWRIKKEDISISALWLMPSPIEIIEEEEGYRLENLYSKSSVHAQIQH